MTAADSIEGIATEPVTPLVNIGEFWLRGAGQFKAYLPEDAHRPHQPDVDSEHVTLTQVHPEIRPHVASVPHLGPDAVWETSLEWSAEAASDALAKCGQLRRLARLRAGRQP